MIGRAVVASVLTAGLTTGLVVAGLDVGPGLGTAAYSTAAPPRRPPIVPPAVPQGAREDWAVWTYVDKINQAWGRDWPLAIEWFEELDARYPGNPMVLDKLYVAYLEDARVHQLRGDIPAARRRYEQAARFDPDRGVAQERLAELDAMQSPPRR
jgi:tetratricopeptide (TPR) repeat protein